MPPDKLGMTPSCTNRSIKSWDRQHKLLFIWIYNNGQVCLSVCLSVCRVSFIYHNGQVCLSVCRVSFIYLNGQISQSVCLSVRYLLPWWQGWFVRLSVGCHLSTLTARLVCPSVCLSGALYLSTLMTKFVCPSVCMFIFSYLEEGFYQTCYYTNTEMLVY